MTFGWKISAIALALIFLAPSAVKVQAVAQTSGVKKIATNLRAFGVPFRIDASDDSYIEVQLYLSRDQGKTWRFHSRQSTDQSEFPFYADQDGTYWFALKTLDRDRRLIPEGDARPELEIEVDTVKPELDFQVQTDGAGRVVCRWRASDKNILPESLKILYQPDDVNSNRPADGQWTSVDVDLTKARRQHVGEVYADQIAWWPDTTTERLNVRLAISDAAGNLSIEDRQINVPHATWRYRSTGIAHPQAPVVPSVAIVPAKEKQHPPGVVCENGVCRLADESPTDFTDATKQLVASASAYGKLSQRRTSPKGFSEKSSEISGGLMPSPQPSPKGRGSERGPRLLGDGAAPPPSRTANRVDDQTSRVRSPLQLVGSQPEIVAPPVPDGYQPPSGKNHTQTERTRLAGLPQPPHSAAAASSNQPSSVAWPSEKQQWAPRNQAAFSTTVGSTMSRLPDAGIAPQRPDPRTLDDGPLASVKPNPGIQLQREGQNIGQSSTNFPANQYQGPPVSPEARQVVTRPPTLLPNHAAADGSNSLGPLQNFAQQHERFYGHGQASELDSGRTVRVEPRSSATPAPFQQSSWPTRGSTLPNSQPEAAATSNTDNDSSSSSFGGVALQMIPTTRFRLDYAIDAIDPSGVKQVDLWMTRDDGRTWELWGKDPDSASPFPVEVQEQGRYGFRVVIQSRDGLSGQGPASGDLPDMLIQVDSEPPLTRITSVPYGRGAEAGKLVINWSVSDPFLSLRPITLSYGRSPRGPWTTIERGLRNTGRHVWKVLPNVPDRIFLKIEATDRAGNIGVHQPSQAIDVSGLVPRGTIRGVQPVGTQ